MITTCSVCSGRRHAQDSMYGTGQRVHNAMKDRTKARCTVCKNIKSVGLKVAEKEVNREEK